MLPGLGLPLASVLMAMISLLQYALVPSGFASLLFLAGLAATFVERSRRSALPLMAASASVFVTFSNGLVATLLISPLEYEYPALRDPGQYPDVQTIVVLTAYASDSDRLSLSAAMNASSALRVLEAANVRAFCGNCQVVVSGSPVAARVMGRQLRQLGVPAHLLKIDASSGNTAASAERLRLFTPDRRIFLVTSAGHMRRAVGVFRKNGLIPVPAPTDYRLPKSIRHASWVTSATHLQASDLAVHEYIGIAWYRLTNRL